MVVERAGQQSPSGFVNALASRIGSFHKEAITDTKKPVNTASLPTDAEIAAEWDAFVASLHRRGKDQKIDGAGLSLTRGRGKPSWIPCGSARIREIASSSLA